MRAVRAAAAQNGRAAWPCCSTGRPGGRTGRGRARVPRRPTSNMKSHRATCGSRRISARPRGALTNEVAAGTPRGLLELFLRDLQLDAASRGGASLGGAQIPSVLRAGRRGCGLCQARPPRRPRRVVPSGPHRSTGLKWKDDGTASSCTTYSSCARRWLLKSAQRRTGCTLCRKAPPARSARFTQRASPHGEYSTPSAPLPTSSSSHGPLRSTARGRERRAGSRARRAAGCDAPKLHLHARRPDALSLHAQ